MLALGYNSYFCDYLDNKQTQGYEQENTGQGPWVSVPTVTSVFSLGQATSLHGQCYLSDNWIVKMAT